MLFHFAALTDQLDVFLHFTDQVKKWDEDLLYHWQFTVTCLFQNERSLYLFRYTSTCRAVSPVGESKGELLIGEDSVFFVADEAISDANYTQVIIM